MGGENALQPLASEELGLELIHGLFPLVYRKGFSHAPVPAAVARRHEVRDAAALVEGLSDGRRDWIPREVAV